MRAVFGTHDIQAGCSVRIPQNLQATRLGWLPGEISFPNSLMAGNYVSADFIDPTPKKKGVE
jgi:hypothetical protein